MIPWRSQTHDDANRTHRVREESEIALEISAEIGFVTQQHY